MFLYKWSFWLMAVLHPYFVSVTEIEYSSGTKEMGVSCKFFTDDLEEALKGAGGQRTDLLKGDREQNRKLIGSYLLKHLRIRSGNTAADLRIIGFENDHEATWCYLEATGIPPGTKFTVESDLLYETRKEQVNLFHVTVDGQRKSARLANPEKQFSLEFR